MIKNVFHILILSILVGPNSNNWSNQAVGNHLVGNHVVGNHVVGNLT